MISRHKRLQDIVRTTFGSDPREMAIRVAAVLVYKAAPHAVDKLFELVVEDGFVWGDMTEKAERIAAGLELQLALLEEEL